MAVSFLIRSGEALLLLAQVMMTSFVLKKQRKLGPSSWHGVKIEKVNRVPDKIDGLKCYKLTNDNVDNTRDGRRWKKASESQWNGYESVRFRDCWGSHRCKNEACAFKEEYS